MDSHQTIDVDWGVHIKKMPSFVETFDRMKDTPLQNYQIYTSNGRANKFSPLNIPDALEAEKILRSNHKKMYVHGCLLHNLAGSVTHRADPKFQFKLECTCSKLISELDAAACMGGSVVAHTGSCSQREKGIDTIAKTIQHVLTYSTTESKKISKSLGTDVTAKRMVLLENSAGEGNKLGRNLQDFTDIFAKIPEDLKPQVGVCIDTAHIFGAGEYDFGVPESVTRFYDDFDSAVGLNYLKLFHFNDSKVPYGSHADRHQNLGLGYIFGSRKDNHGTDGLDTFLREARDRGIPLISEPPKDGSGGIWDYEIIKEVCKMRKGEVEDTTVAEFECK